MILFILIFAFVSFVSCGTDKNPIVFTKQGKIQGELSSNGLYYEFPGITYAIPVKFRAPSEPLCFPGVKKANQRALFCPQFTCNDPLAIASDTEDCLVLNVFTPKTYLTNSSYPVMVYIHGGGFGTGSGSPSIYGPQYLVSHDVIVVTLNYRLNAYGFLNLGIKEAPGNAGLKDIRAALRWVKDNIDLFGGDVDNVTVFGQGTGGIAALYLTFSESCKGLFHKVISQSGGMFSPAAFDFNGLNTASQVAKSLSLTSQDPVKLFKLFNDVPVMELEQAISKQMNPTSVFRPTVEKIFDDEEAFLVDTPFNILQKGSEHPSFNPVPIIIGLNTVEGLTCTLDYNTITSQMDRIKNEDYTALEVKSLHLKSDEKTELQNILKETYFNGNLTDESIIGGIINMNSDFSFVGPISLFSELYSNTSTPVFEYIFDYIGNRNLGRLLTNTSLPATTNMDELFYIFELERLPLPMDEDDARIVTFMTMMWTNFAKFGSPTPETNNGEWLPFPHHLAILLEPQYVAPLTPDRSYFWRTVYYRYGAEIRSFK